MAGSPMAPVSNLGFPGGGVNDPYWSNGQFNGQGYMADQAAGQLSQASPYWNNGAFNGQQYALDSRGGINFDNVVGMGVIPKPIASVNNPNNVGGTSQPVGGSPYWSNGAFDGQGYERDMAAGKIGSGLLNNPIDFSVGLTGGSPYWGPGGFDGQGYERDMAAGKIGPQPAFSGNPVSTFNDPYWGPGGFDGQRYMADNPGYAQGVEPTPGYTIQPGTAAAQYGGGMTAQDAAAQAQTYYDLQARLAGEAAFYEAQQRALPSSPQNYYSQIVQPYERNFGGQITGYNSFSTQYQPY